MPQQRPDARFKNDILYVFWPREVQLIKAWPDLSAVRKHDRGVRWLTFEPDYPLIRPYRRRRRPKPSDRPAPSQLELPLGLPPVQAWPNAAERRKRAFDGFRFACPRPIARRVEPFRTEHLPLLRLLEVLGAAGDLLDSSPALGFCLALAMRDSLDNRRRHGVDPTSAAAIAAGKQTDIMARLGLPSTRRAARALARVRPESMTRQLLPTLSRLLADEEALKLLSHLPALPVGVLSLVADLQMRGLVAPALLEQVSAEPRERHFPFTARQLGDVLQMAETLGVDLSRRRFRERGRISALHDELARDYVRLHDHRLTGCRFPRPPIPGTDAIQPLRSPRALIDEGRIQDNCVASYSEQVADGDTFIYRVLRPERATLSLVRVPGGEWQIDELLRAHNRPVSAATRRAVQLWLDGYRL
jgi:hypothetical protein